MASYELNAFDRRFQAISLVGAVEQVGPYILNVGYWLRDPNQLIQFPELVASHPRQDFLWEKTCFEIFIGVKDQDFYREINLSPSQAWQAYQFDEYRYPEQIPPLPSHDIDLVQLKKTHFGLSASVDLTMFMSEHQLRWTDLFVGLTAVIQTNKQTHYFAMQHSGALPDFHNKHDWLQSF